MGKEQNPNLSLDELYIEARASMPILEKKGQDILGDLRKKHPGVFDGATFEMGPLKEKDRAEKKIHGEYEDKHSLITDLARARIIIDRPEQVEILRNYFKEVRPGFTIEKLKDRFAEPSLTNFRDLNMQVRLENGHMVEFRVEQSDMLLAGKKTHNIYASVQEIEHTAENENRALTLDESIQKQTLLDSARAIHGAPAKASGIDRLLNEKGRELVAKQEAERLPPVAQNDPKYHDPSKLRTAEHHAGRATGVAGIAVDAAAGNYGAAAAGAAMEAANSKAGLAVAERTALAVAGSAAKNIGKRIPVIGAAITAGFVAYEVGSHALAGNGKAAAAAAAAGSAEIAGNIVGFGAGDAAREVVRGAAIAVAGKDAELVEKSGLRQLGEKTIELAHKFNSTSPGTPAQMAEVQANLLKNAQLDQLEMNGKKVDVAAILRDPKQRDAFIEKLQDSAKDAKNPDTKDHLEHMATSAQAYVKLEERRSEMMAVANEPLMRRHTTAQPTITAGLPG